MTFQTQHELQLTIACEADHWTIYLSGDLDAPQCCGLVEVTEVLAASRVAHLTIDLGAVTSVDRAGQQSIREAASVIESRGGAVRVISPKQPGPTGDRMLQPAGG